MGFDKSKEDLSDHPAKIKNPHGAFRLVPLSMIKTDPNQPRKTFKPKEMEELIDSIKNKGVLQPIIVRVGGEEIFWVTAGERRFRAAQEVGLSEIPAIISEDNPAEIALIENIQRVDLNPIEEAFAYKRIMNDFNYTQEHLSKIVGKSQATISETLSLNNLPDEIKEECLSLDIPKNILVDLVKIKTLKRLIFAFKKLKEGERNKDLLRNKTNLSSNEKLLKKLELLKKEFNKTDPNSLLDKEKIYFVMKINEFMEYVENSFNKTE
jgi:ParB family chromosome partitioning protein